MSRKLRISVIDILLLIAAVLPILGCILLQVTMKPASNGIEVAGALVYWELPMADVPSLLPDFLTVQPLVDAWTSVWSSIPAAFTTLYISEAQVNSWAVVLAITFLCLFLTRKLSVRTPSVRQHLAEWIVQTTEKLVKDNMGDYFAAYAPFITAIIGLSALSSLSSLLGLFPPTTDMNVVAGWAILVFVVITYYKLKCGPLYYAKGLCEPVFFLAPINVIGEFATPISMAFRHYGNVLSGVVVSILVSAGLTGASSLVLGWLPGMLGEIPFLRVGIPAVLSVYFDIFSGCLQAFIFAMLTMMYVSGAFPMEDYFARRAKKQAKKKSKLGGN